VEAARDPRAPRARTVYVDDRLWRAISIESERQRTTVSAFVRTACENELEVIEEQDRAGTQAVAVPV
jgi:hypothetical protein